MQRTFRTFKYFLSHKSYWVNEMVGNLFDRVVSVAEIRGRSVKVNAVVRHKSLVYTTESPDGNAGLFGKYRTIVVNGEAVRCGISEFSSELCGWLGTRDSQELRSAVTEGDLVRAYLMVVNCIALGLESERRDSASADRRLEIEHDMARLNSIKHDLVDNVMVTERRPQTAANSGILNALAARVYA